MKQEDPMKEDMFEKAREAFFGTVKTPPKPSAFPAEFLKPRNELPPTKVTGPYSNQGEATQPLVLIAARANLSSASLPKLE
jgi:hypothetical protein